MKPTDKLADRSHLPKEVDAAVTRTLREGEVVHVVLDAWMGQWLVATDQRVLTLKYGHKGWGGWSQEHIADYALSAITGVSMDAGRVMGKIVLHVPGQTVGVKDGEVDPDKAPNAVKIAGKLLKDAVPGVDVIRELLRTHAASALVAAPDPVDQLRKLAELRDLGVLTTQEFDSKKKELLGRL